MSGPRIEVPQLRPGDLFEKRKQRDGAKLKSYNKILEQIYGRIKTASRDGADPWVIYTCPPFILGLPKIDLEDCIVYLVYMLRAQTYEVRYTYPNLLYISWKHHEKDYILKGSPIMQSMLATQSTKPKGELRGQSQARVRFMDQALANGPPQNGYGAPFGSAPRQGQQGQQGQGQQAQQFNQSLGRAPPRSVTSYEPPTSFLDAIEKAPVSEPRKSAIDDFLNF
jgi:hypothetical protein